MGFLSFLAPVVGGLLGQRAERRGIEDQNAYNDPSAVRARFEKAGLNPLLGFQSGVGMQQAVGGTNYIGSGIADSLMAVSNAQDAKSAEKAEKEKLIAENTKLRRQVEVETIRPRVGGLYSRAQGETISMGNPPRGWISEYDADFVGKKVMAGPFGAGSDAYYGRNPERTVITTPLGDTTPENTSDAEEWEKRYGDPVSWAVGLGTLAMDAGRSVRSYTDGKGWTEPQKWVGQDTAKGAWDMFGLGEAKRGKDARPLKSGEQSFVLR